MAKKVLFIHRSVGRNLLKDGGLAQLIVKADSSIDFKDIDNNKQKGVPGDDTKPADYAKYFSNNSCDEDLVIIKSCYPNNAIKSDQGLEQLKESYSAIISGYLKNSKGKLLIMTTPALRPLHTNPEEAARARELAEWLKVLKTDNRVSIFDFYDLLAEPKGDKHANMLRRQYMRLGPWDNHPNKAASRHIAPILAKKIVEL